jgi:DNA repair ATPase RecN
MDDKNKNTATDVDESEDQEDQDQDDVAASKKSYTPEEYAKVCSEAKTYRKDKAALKKEKDDLAAKLQAIENEKLSDTEKKDREIIELRKQLAENDQKIKNNEIDNQILKGLSGKNIVDMDAAITLVRKEVDAEEDPDIPKIIDKVLKAKPFLISGTKVNPSNGNFERQDNEAKKTGVEALQGMLNNYK